MTPTMLEKMAHRYVLRFFSFWESFFIPEAVRPTGDGVIPMVVAVVVVGGRGLLSSRGQWVSGSHLFLNHSER